MKFSMFAFTAIGGLTSVLAVAPQNDECENALPIFCGFTYIGDTTNATVPVPPPPGCEGGTGPNNYGNNKGVWYKLSTGSDTFEIVLDTCDGTSYNSYISLYSGGCGELKCVGGNNNYEDCTKQSLLGPLSPFADEDYWVQVHGGKPNVNGANSHGPFTLTVTCGAAIDVDHIDEEAGTLGPIDEWYIQRSARPPPEVISADPVLEGGIWVELSELQEEVQDLPGDFPRLKATLHQISAFPRCQQGLQIDEDQVTFTAIPCDDSDATPPCSQRMNSDSVAVLQKFEINDPTNPNKGIWDEELEQFNFCVHTFLETDYLPEELGLDEVSYFDTFFAVEMDYSSASFEILNVAALSRNPNNVSTIFDKWLVDPYLCDEDNNRITIVYPNPEDPEITQPSFHDYFVGETFRICIVPSEPYENLEVERFINVKCYQGEKERDLIEDGDVTSQEVDLTEIATDPPAGGIAFESTVTSLFVHESAPWQFFACTGSVEMKHPDRRILQDGGDEALALLPEDGDVTGSFKVTLRIVTPEPDGLSTGAIVGISMAAFAVFLVALLILYRRGCFDKKMNNKHPKTVSVPEEDSETSGDNNA